MRRLFNWSVRVFAWNPIRYLVLSVLYILKPVISVKLVMLGEARIGQFAKIGDYYARLRHYSESSKSKGIWIGLAGDPSNDQLLKMFKRVMPIMPSRRVSKLLRAHMFSNSPFVVGASEPTSEEYHRLCNAPPILSFTNLEEVAGRRLLIEMGVPEDALFVCFHARDTAYYKGGWMEDTIQEGQVLNCSIANFIDAMNYIANCGGYAIRMGAKVDEPLGELANNRIIDYATTFRSDFGDIYIAGHCKFFVGCWSGLAHVAPIFNIPTVLTNMFPSAHRSGVNRDLMIFKQIRSKEKGRLLSFPEILGTEIAQYSISEQFTNANLIPEENSPMDILKVTKEMNEFLDGSLIFSGDHQELRDRFESIWENGEVNDRRPPAIGVEFLRSHKDLIGR